MPVFPSKFAHLFLEINYFKNVYFLGMPQPSNNPIRHTVKSKLPVGPAAATRSQSSSEVTLPGSSPEAGNSRGAAAVPAADSRDCEPQPPLVHVQCQPPQHADDSGPSMHLVPFVITVQRRTISLVSVGRGSGLLSSSSYMIPPNITVPPSPHPINPTTHPVNPAPTQAATEPPPN